MLLLGREDDLGLLFYEAHRVIEANSQSKPIAHGLQPGARIKARASRKLIN